MRWSPAHPARPSCPHRRLRNLLSTALPDRTALADSTFRPWASASFVGARHIFSCKLAADDPAAVRDALWHRLNNAEWTLPGHIVADATVTWESAPQILRVEILTVED